MDYPKLATGDLLHLAFPTTIESLLEQGPDFLTAAFHASGALAADNRVLEIVHSKEFYGGGMGRKLVLSVRYAKPDENLHEELFLKFPRNFGDPLRELFTPLMEPEVRFALLSRQAEFPIQVPRCYYADYSTAACSGLLITEKIPFGQGGIEPPHEKCEDYAMPNPLEHYRALTLVLARIAGAHKAGKLGDDLDQHYPHDFQAPNAADRIPYSAEELRAKLDDLATFIIKVPQLFPDNLRDQAFIKRFLQEAPLFLDHEPAIRLLLNSNDDFIALCHWNANVDNAWFWRDAQGELQAGLLDWGSVGRMSIAQAFFGLICAAETNFLEAHKDELLALFAAEYLRSGGPALDIVTLGTHLKLAIGILGIAWMLNAPALIEAQIPDFETLSGRHDPRLRADFLARAQLQLLTVFLNEWHTGDIGALVPSLFESH